MKKFVYAYINFFEGDPQVRTVEAEDAMGALKEIFFDSCSGADEELLNDSWENFSGPEDVIQYLFDGDIGISMPVAVDEI